MTAYRTSVRLQGIVHRRQGTHDSLCAYYAAAMMLCALRPEFDIAFECSHVSGDPLYANLPRSRKESVTDVAADWLTTGVRLSDLARALDKACAGGTRFRFQTVDDYDFLCAQVDLGLPCVIGWESGELGNHTSVVVGYDRYRRSKSRWLRLLDPIHSQDTIDWNQLVKLATTPVELIWCTAHTGVRPDKLTVERDASGGMLPGHKIERWDPRSDGWASLV